MVECGKCKGVCRCPWLAEGQFPTRESCNLQCPEEAFLWMFVAIPGMRGAPVPFPLKYLRMLSRRIWNCGGRVVAEQTEFYHPPLSGDISPSFAAGRWKDKPAPPARNINIDDLSPADQREVARQVDAKRARGRKGKRK